MDGNRLHRADVSETPRPRVYSADLQPLLQSLMSTLANMDFEYDQERSRMHVDPRDGTLKLRMLQKLQDRHQERRRPYVEQVILLQDRMSQAAQ
jgi:hypothetical protein